MTVCSRPTSADLRRLADWLYSRRSHQWRATYSGSTTIVIGRLLVRRPGQVEDVEIGRQRPDQGAVRRLDDHQRDAGNLALPLPAELLGRVGVLGDEHRADVRRQRPPEVDGLDDGAVDPVDRDDDPLLAMRQPGTT